LTTKHTLVENVRERVLFNNPTCTLESNWVNTFDNVTYKFNKDVTQHCEHVLTSDCSGKWPMAVLVRNINTDNKIITMLLGAKTKIEIMPTTTMIMTRFNRHHIENDENRFRVLVNGQVVSTFPHVIHVGEEHKIAKIEMMVNGGVQVRTQRIHVATDCNRVVVFGYNDFRNRTCGLCGNFDNEKISEFRSPKDCPLSTGSLLVASYAFSPIHSNENGQCVIKPEIKNKIVKEEQDCKISPRVNLMSTSGLLMPRTMIFDEDTKTMDPEMTMDNTDTMIKTTMDDSDEDEDNCWTTEKLIRNVEDYGMCTSEKRLRTCARGCYAKNMMTKNVLFDCYHRDYVTPMGNTIQKQLTVHLPTECVRSL
jgi:hypothetical protein